MTTESLLLRGGRVVDVVGKRLREADVVIEGGMISRVGHNAAPPRGPLKVVDLNGRVIAPGFIDSHLHIESSMLTPLAFARAAVRHGTTAVFADPHEIANVCGRAGIDLFLRQAAVAPLDLYVGIPSCVPATTLEDSGATITTADVCALVHDARVYGLAEMMDYPGIIHGTGTARQKVEQVLARGKLVDGHAPGLTGQDLLAYVSNGRQDGRVRIMSDHECRTAEEARTKRAAGMQVALRYGSASKDLPRILPGLLEAGEPLDGYMLCSDDLDPLELYAEGHMDRAIRCTRDILHAHGRAAEAAAIQAIALATLHPARYFAPFFRRHGMAPMGEIAPGARANLVVLESLESLAVAHVIHRGRLVAAPLPAPSTEETLVDGACTGPLHMARPLGPEDFAPPYTGLPGTVDVRVIGLTDGLGTRLRTVATAAHPGEPLVPPDTARIAVVERHHATGSFAVGFVERCLTSGAIAATIAHDSHNVIVIGVDPGAMARAVEHLRAHGGGLVAVGERVSYLPLPIGGLMATESIESVAAGYRRLREALPAQGASPDLFVRMSFLALPVIPEVRITNRGLVDVDRFALVGLY